MEEEWMGLRRRAGLVQSLLLKASSPGFRADRTQMRQQVGPSTNTRGRPSTCQWDRSGSVQEKGQTWPLIHRSRSHGLVLAVLGSIRGSSAELICEWLRGGRAAARGERGFPGPWGSSPALHSQHRDVAGMSRAWAALCRSRRAGGAGGFGGAFKGRPPRAGGGAGAAQGRGGCGGARPGPRPLRFLATHGKQ